MHVYSTGNLAAAIGSNDVYIGFGGGTGSDVSTQTISNFSYTVTGPGMPAVYVNNVVLNGGTNSTIDVAAAATGPTVTMGTLSVGSGAGTTLNVTATTAPMDQAYGLTFGATTLAGNVTFNVANNGAGTGTLTLGAISDGGTNSSITKTGAGTLTLTGVNSFSGNLTIAAGAVVQSGGTLATTVSNQASFSLTGGAFSGQLLNNGSFVDNGGTFSGQLVNNGSFNYNAGMFSGQLINQGSAAFNANFTAGNGVVNYTSLTAGSGFTFTLNGGGLDNEGSFLLNGGTLAGAGPLVNGNTLSGYGTITGSGGFTNNAFLNITGGNLTLSNTGVNSNVGA